jgi:gamma-glutamyl hercynylcysteine S-oxide synthase
LKARLLSPSLLVIGVSAALAALVCWQVCAAEPGPCGLAISGLLLNTPAGSAVPISARDFPLGGFHTPTGKSDDIRHVEQFLLCQREVTVAQYAAFIAAGGYTDQQYWSADGWAWQQANGITAPESWERQYAGATTKPAAAESVPAESGGDAPASAVALPLSIAPRLRPPADPQTMPVSGVSYYEAEAFARWADGRLPSELEWEAAMRGSEGRIYPWGNEWDAARCTSADSGVGRTPPPLRGAGMWSATPEGVEDLLGSVWEWTDQPVADYPDYPLPESFSPTMRILRGGSYWSYEWNGQRLLPALRLLQDPGYRQRDTGFRVAFDLVREPSATAQ